MTVYADYEFYMRSYYGYLEEEEFQTAIRKASAHIRRITFGRADSCSDMDEVKFATCAACDVIAADAKRRKKHDGMNIASENTDGYAVNFVAEQASGESAEQALNKSVYSAAKVYLEPIGLLDWGVYDDDEF